VKLELSPEGQSELTLCDALAPAGAEEIWLTLEVVQPQATAWSDAGHRVAWQQFPLAAPLALRRLPSARRQRWRQRRGLDRTQRLAAMDYRPGERPADPLAGGGCGTAADAAARPVCARAG
jgi:beta-galactosidase/beta-glucuronidase